MGNNRTFDKDELLKRFDGEKEFLAELIEIFANDTPEQFSKIQKAVDNRNGKDLETSAHKLKGAIANFEQKAAFEAALTIEVMGKENRLDGAEEAYNTLANEVDHLVNALKEFVK